MKLIEIKDTDDNDKENVPPEANAKELKTPDKLKALLDEIRGLQMEILEKEKYTEMFYQQLSDVRDQMKDRLEGKYTNLPFPEPCFAARRWLESLQLSVKDYQVQL